MCFVTLRNGYKRKAYGNDKNTTASLQQIRYENRSKIYIYIEREIRFRALNLYVSLKVTISVLMEYLKSTGSSVYFHREVFRIVNTCNSLIYFLFAKTFLKKKHCETQLVLLFLQRIQLL